jgi:transposase
VANVYDPIFSIQHYASGTCAFGKTQALIQLSQSFTPPEVYRVGFAPVIVAAVAEPVIAAAPVNGRMVIIVGKDRQVIVDAGVDAAALSRVLQVLERR